MSEVTLIVVRNRNVAMHAGCGHDLRHRADPFVRFWWPELGYYSLNGIKFERIIVESDVRLNSVGRENIRAIARRAPVIEL